MVLPSGICLEDDFPDGYTACDGADEDVFDIAVVSSEESRIFSDKIAENSCVAVTCGFARQILEGVDSWVWFGKVLGVISRS